jgi:hypothetical protein
MQDEEFNMDELRIEEEPIETGRLASKIRLRRQDQFVMVPLEWMHRLVGARSATYSLALHLLHRAFKERSKTIKLANRLLTSGGISRGQKWRALAQLETLGLVSVEHRGARKSPIITLLYPQQEA